MVRNVSLGCALAAALALADGPATAQHISIADPHCAHRVEGRVLLPDSAPAVGVVVERTATPRGDTPFSEGAYRETTDSLGNFRFFFSGLGLGTGRTWYLAVRRPNCPATVVTLTLTPGRVTPDWEGDLSVGNIIRLRPCDAPDAATPDASAPSVQPPRHASPRRRRR